MINKEGLKAAIKASGKSQKQIAADMGICKNALSMKVTGRRSFTVEEMASFCESAGIGWQEAKMLFAPGMKEPEA